MTLFTYGSLTTENITAGDGNDVDTTGNASGASLYSSGILTMTGTNTFNNNNYYGLFAGSDVEVFMENIRANGNSALGSNWYGMYVSSPGDIVLTGTNIFNDNYNDGMFIDFWDAGSFTAENVTANGNGVSGTGNGVTFSSYTVEALFLCGQFSNNAGYGIDAAAVAGDFTLNDVIFSGNGSGDFNYSGTATVLTGGCTPVNPVVTPAPIDDSGGKAQLTGFGTGLPLQIAGETADLDCDLFSGTVLVLPNGDKVTFKCPISGTSSLNSLTNDNIPSALPDGVEFVSGMYSTQGPVGSDKALEGQVIISFLIPDGMQGSDLAILYWDGTEWVDLDSASFEDGRMVFNGGYATGDGYFEAFTNFSGNFVLVKK